MTNQSLDDIKNRGCVDKNKYKENTRILSININGLNLKNDEKLDQIIESCQKLQVDTIFITEPNIKWTTSNRDKIQKKMNTY